MNAREHVSLSSIRIELPGAKIWSMLDEPSCYIHFIKGRILFETVPDSEEEIAVGTFRVVLVNADGADLQGLDPRTLFDTYAATWAYYEALYAGSRFNDKVRAISGDFEPLWSNNLLVLDRLEVLPAYRGRSIGLHALTALMLHFQAGVQIVAMRPYPLQFEADAELELQQQHIKDGISPTEAKATQALRRYYRQLGFKLVRGTPYMVRPTAIPLRCFDPE
jgi:GNAT superfamily N-acetyltransferase